MLAFKNKSKMHGAGLIEVLVALMIISIGFVGMTAMQTKALRFNHDAYLRTQASILAYDILDRMRANRFEAMSNSAYDTVLGDDPSASTACESASCSTAALAAYDQAQWLDTLKQELPQGDGTVSVNASKVTVTVQWDASRGQSAANVSVETLEALL